MRIAVFLNSINYKEINDGVKVVFLFDVDQDVITAIGKQLIVIYNLSYLITWLLGKGVETAYIPAPDKLLKREIERTGIAVESLEKIKDNPLLSSLKLSVD